MVISLLVSSVVEADLLKLVHFIVFADTIGEKSLFSEHPINGSHLKMEWVSIFYAFINCQLYRGMLAASLHKFYCMGEFC